MTTPLSASGLRRELSYRSRRFRASHPHEVTYGMSSSVIFRDQDGDHGNFHPPSYQAILASEAWSKRMTKSYAGGRWVPRSFDHSRAELDCANSSDALLMNIFCYPLVTELPRLFCLLGIERGVVPVFGFKPRLAHSNGKTDQTEIDLKLGSLLIEAKLTESGFQTASMDRAMRYAGIEEAFDFEELPRKENSVQSWQLIRGVLAASLQERSFAVLCDARRTDLIERWFLVMRAVRSSALRSRLSLVTWQEVAAAVPPDLQIFLDSKYGIVAG